MDTTAYIRRSFPGHQVLPRLFDRKLFLMACVALLSLSFSSRVRAGLNVSFAGSTLDITSDGSDSISVACSAGLVTINGVSQGIPCANVFTLRVFGGPGPNNIQLFGVVAPLNPSQILVEGRGGADFIAGSSLNTNETLDGGGDNDTIFGGGGNDTLRGGAGNDSLFGDAGVDQLEGGPGDDNYTITMDTDTGIDVIVELPGEGTNDRATVSGTVTTLFTVTNTSAQANGLGITFDSNLERLTVQGDVFGGSASDDTYVVTASASTTITVSDDGNTGGDVLRYSAEGECPIEVGNSITANGKATVFYSGVETIEYILTSDCNSNGLEDLCEVPPIGLPENDCDNNIIPDDCQIPPIGPAINDCNSNQFPDACDVVASSGFPGGTCQANCSVDCNENGKPDECETEDCDNDGIPDNCESDVDSDTIPDDCDNCTPGNPLHHCGDPGVNCVNPTQTDTDGDGIGDDCDNCPHFCNPDQADDNQNGVGDICELTIAGELFAPPNLQGCPGDYSNANVTQTAAAIVDSVCSGGTNDGEACFSDGDCPSGGSCFISPSSSVTPPHTVFYYANTNLGTGGLFAKEMAPSGTSMTIMVQWKDVNGNDVGLPVGYFLTDQPPDEIEDDPSLPYNVAVPDVYSNLLFDFPNAPIQLNIDLFPVIRYNSVILEDPPGLLVPHLQIRQALDVYVVEAAPSIPNGYVVVQWTRGNGGILEGFEVLHIHQIPPPPTQFEQVGRQLAIPPGADCKAQFLRNGTLNNAAAWQRSEATLEVWPIRPEPTETNLQIQWYRQTSLDHCWPVAWTRHRADWPADPQIHVIDFDGLQNPSRVVLPVGDDDYYCAATVMYPDSSQAPFAQIANDSEFAASAPGYAVVRFDILDGSPGAQCNPQFREAVRFEVVRSLDHRDTSTQLFDGSTVFDGVLPWLIGTQLDDPRHDPSTPNFPYGYLYSGQPVNAGIYADTKQIFPVNVSDIHGRIEAWWYQEGSFAENIYWPHKVVEYDADWPTADDPTTPNDDPIIIASRLGAGSYPSDPETTVYSAGDFVDYQPPGTDNSLTLPGWNPNDEHGILLSSGNQMVAYASRDDDPWNAISGHPFVLVQYRDAPPPEKAGSGPVPWGMGVHPVIGEQDPFYFDYSQFAFEPPALCGCIDASDALAVCSFADPGCFCDEIDPVCACELSNPDCNCSDPGCVCDTMRCVGGSSAGRVCNDVSDCDCSYGRVCLGGQNDGQYCSVSRDCPGCVDGDGIAIDCPCEEYRECNGGTNDGQFCSLRSQCPGCVDNNNSPIECPCEPRPRGLCSGGQIPGTQCGADTDCSCDVAVGTCTGPRQSSCIGGPVDGADCDTVEDCCPDADPTCLTNAVCMNDGASCSGTICFGGSNDAADCLTDTDCPGGACAVDCLVSRCEGSLNTGSLCTTDNDCDCSGVSGIPVVAGLPLEPLFPVNFGAAPCESGIPPAPLTTVSKVCIGGSADGSLCDDDSDCPTGTCTSDGVWVDRTGVIWAAEAYVDENPTVGSGAICFGGANDGAGCNSDANCLPDSDGPGACREPSGAAIRLFENWSPDRGCQPWRAYAPVDGVVDPAEPYPIVYRTSWPSTQCDWPNEPTCPRPVRLGETVVDQTNQCGSFRVLHDSAGIKFIDTTYEVSVPYLQADFPPDVDFRELPPHLFGGTIGGALPREDRIRYENDELYFRGIMSVRDAIELKKLSTDSTYQAKIDGLYTLSLEQLTTPLVNPNEKFVSAADASTQPGWVVLAFQNDDFCAPLGSPTVQVWRVDCDPLSGRVFPLTPTCPFNEKQVMQHSIDGGGNPEQLVYQWQWSESRDGPWNDYNAPSGPPGCTPGVDCYADGVGLREVIISGSSPFTLADTWWRVRYRGYGNCPCDTGPGAIDGCNEGADPWPSFLKQDNSRITEWTEPQLAEGWVKRVLRGLNPFDQRIRDFHSVPTATYVSMIEQAGNRFEAPVALNCTPENINNVGLIEVYSTVLGRARLFSIDQGISFDPANLALMLISNQISELYMLLGHEAASDAIDPTIGFFGNTPPADPTAAFAFEGIVPSLLEEELGMLRGMSEHRPPIVDADGFVIATPYNRLLWNFPPGATPGRIAYANNYQFTNEIDALEAFPQGHGDAWGHYLTAMKQYYRLLKNPVFDWVNSTEFFLVAGQQPQEVTYQYERRFARAAAAKAKTGAAITSLTFRQLYTADPSQQDGYPDPTTEFPTRKWGVSDWGRRAGQGAYFDWLMANALVDDKDDDPDHQGTIRKVDRTTISELKEISAAFQEIQTTVSNADDGLNPMGLSTEVVPFGLSPSQIDSGKTHFDQIYERAVKALSSTVQVFNFANQNTKRLRSQQNTLVDFENNIAERERDFTNRLIELFGRPYPEDIGPPPAAYSPSECPNGQCPDLFHFDYVEPSALTGRPAPDTRTYTITFVKTGVDGTTGEATESIPRPIDFVAATNGYGLIKPSGWSERPEPGAIQLARSELLQAIGKYNKALIKYQLHWDDIVCQVDTLNALYGLQADVLKIKSETLAEEISLRAGIRAAEILENQFKSRILDMEDITEASFEAVPDVIGAGLTVVTDIGAIPKGVMKTLGVSVKKGFKYAAEAAKYTQIALQEAIPALQGGNALRITGAENVFAAVNQVWVVEKLVRESPAIEVEVNTAIEAVNQAIGRYHAAVGRGVRLLDQRTAFRQKTAAQLSRYRYQDIAFRVFRNEALQKYRAQYDLLSQYVFLSARAYDYETNLLATDQDSGTEFLEDLIRERLIGRTICSAATGVCTPQVGNGLSGRLAGLKQNFDILRGDLGFNSPDEFDRTFSMRWEAFRIPTATEGDQQWKDALESFKVADLNTLDSFNQFAAPIPGAPSPNPALVIPFRSTIQAGQNFFGHPSIGDVVLPPDRFAIKLHSYTVRFQDYPGLAAGLVEPVSVYVLPIGADVMRVPECPFPIREWHLIDQTLPSPNPLGLAELEVPEWMPWDSIQGGAQGMVRRRLIPSVGAGDFIDNPSLSLCSGSIPGDESFKLTGRSVWNTNWLLVIPESALSGSPQIDGIDVFINGTDTIPGVSDIKFLICGYGYTFSSGCPSSDEENDQ